MSISSPATDHAAVRELSKREVGALPELVRQLQGHVKGLARARIFHSVAQNAVAGTTVLTFDSERWDTDGMHDPAAPTKLTIVRAGTYLVFGTVAFQVDGTGSYRRASILLNGLTYIARSDRPPAPAVVRPYPSPSTAWDFVAGDYVELVAEHDATSTLTVDPVPAISAEFGAVRLV